MTKYPVTNSDLGELEGSFVANFAAFISNSPFARSLGDPVNL